MKKNILKRSAAVIAAALTLLCCGISASAESVIAADAPAAAAAEENAGAAFYGYDGDYDYDIITTANSGSSEKEEKNWVKIIIVALVVSLLATGIIIFVIYRGYKYNGMTEPYEYKNKAPLELSDREDVLIDVHVTTRHIEKNNNNN